MAYFTVAGFPIRHNKHSQEFKEIPASCSSGIFTGLYRSLSDQYQLAEGWLSHDRGCQPYFREIWRSFRITGFWFRKSGYSREKLRWILLQPLPFCLGTLSFRLEPVLSSLDLPFQVWTSPFAACSRCAVMWETAEAMGERSTADRLN